MEAPMSKLPICLLPLLSAMGPACSDSKDAKNTDSGFDVHEHEDQGPDLAAESCEPTSSSTLPNVSFEFTGDRCSWTLDELSAGIKIPYVLTVGEEADGVPVDLQLACRGVNESGLQLVTLELITGSGDEHFCLCDEGDCATEIVTETLVSGQYFSEIDWDGSTWNGPSDTGTPRGPLFSAGPATASVSAAGELADGTAFEVKATLPITVR